MDKILIVDDEKPMLDAITGALDGLPFQLITTQNPCEGLTLFHEHAPFLTILDMVMAPIDGVDFIKHLIQHELPDQTNLCVPPQPSDPERGNPDLRDANFYVAILTGAGSKTLMRECKALGVHYFLNKPISVHTLHLVIVETHRLKLAHEDFCNSYKVNSY